MARVDGSAIKISIHALREEGDLSDTIAAKEDALFLSTPSARRATLQAMADPDKIAISIHALREEGDSCNLARCRRSSYFYPRPPRGGRQP